MATRRTLSSITLGTTLLLAGGAGADFVGIQTEDYQDPLGIWVCNVYAQFTDPSDQLVEHSGSLGDPGIIEVIGGEFYQHPLGGDTAPPCGSPQLASDTFVTIGMACDDGSDMTQLTPDWPGFGGWAILDNAGWFSFPFEPQTFAGPEERVLLGRFSTPNGDSIFGDLIVQVFQNGAPAEFPVSFLHEFSGGNQPPTATIVAISPDRAREGTTVSFEGDGADDGEIVGYHWRSDLDGYLSDQHQFETSTMHPGRHTIFLKVEDDDGAWSQEVSATVDVAFYFVQLSDLHYGYWGARTNVNKIIDKLLASSRRPRFVIVTGDVLSWGAAAPGLPPKGMALHDFWSHDYGLVALDLDRLQDEGIAVIVAPGNHDQYQYPYFCWNLDNYNEYFVESHSYGYGITNLSVRVMSRSSGCDELFEEPIIPPKGSGMSEGALSWIENVLDGLDGQDNGVDLSSTIKILAMHHPTINYMAGSKGEQCYCIIPPGPCDRWDAGVIRNRRGELLDLCAQYAVDVIASGHIHRGRVYTREQDGSMPEGWPDPYPSSSQSPLFVNTADAWDGYYREYDVYADSVEPLNDQPVDDSIEGRITWLGYLFNGAAGDEGGAPVELHLFDGQDGHVGRDASGVTEFEIAHARYAFLPLTETDEDDPALWEATTEEIGLGMDGELYVYEIRGTDDGIVSFSVRKDLLDDSTTTLVFNDLALTATSVGTLSVEQTSVAAAISMDDDGDGIVDRQIEPDIMITVNAPAAPARPDGYEFGHAQSEYVYETVTTDPEGDDIHYWIDWGDGSSTGWIGPVASGAPMTAEWVWDEPGVYPVRARAMDETGFVSDWSATRVMTVSCRGDVNNDETVDVDDLVTLVLSWGGMNEAADINADGVISVEDLVEVIMNWGPCT